MLRTLRIASIVTAAAAACVVVLVAVFGLKGNPEIEGYLDQTGVVEEYKNKTGQVAAREDADSPLVNQARAFALRIDPPKPPPPPPPPPPPTANSTQVANKNSGSIAPPPPPPPPPAKFTLMGTAVYPEHPEKSLVLVKDVRNEYKWYRQGETIGRQVIQEVRDGSVVLFANGQRSEELFVPQAPAAKSLLKNDTVGGSGAPSVIAASTSSIMPPEMPTEPRQGRTVPNRTMPNRASGSEGYRRVSELPPAANHMRTPPPVQTPEQQVESLDESINSIKEIMAHEAAGTTPEEQAQMEATWKGLLEVLEAEKQNLEKMQESAPAEQPPVADQ